MRTLNTIFEAIQFFAARAANTAPPPRLPTAHDLLKAKWIAEYLHEGDSILDVGSGNGSRLRDLSLFVSELETLGLEIGTAKPGGNQLPFGQAAAVNAFDGKTLPCDDQSFDVVMICYVLHHLTQQQCVQTIREAIRVARRRIILLEDSLPEFNLAYRLRNWAHIADTNLTYSSRSGFVKVDTSGFRTHQQWIEFLGEFEEVADVSCVPLTQISRYAHHTMFVVELDKQPNGQSPK